jgi:hypothetical protein
MANVAGGFQHPRNKRGMKSKMRKKLTFPWSISMIFSFLNNLFNLRKNKSKKL